MTSHSPATQSIVNRYALTIYLSLVMATTGLAEPMASLPDSLAVDLHEIDVTALKAGHIYVPLRWHRPPSALRKSTG